MSSKIELNDYITIGLEYNKILIYIQGERFQELEYSFLNKIINASKIQLEEVKNQVNTAENLYKMEVENENFINFLIILKLWIQNNYDTDILVYDFSFPLLKKLVEVGDPLAKKVFINEILKNLWGADPLVVRYLIDEKYDSYVALYNFRTEIHYPKFKEIKITIFLCIINIIFYIFFTEIYHIEIFYIFDLDKILNNFEVWRIFTAIFMHSGRFPLFINTFFLCSVGSYFEVNNLLSKSIYVIVYIISGIVGNIGYTLISPLLPYYITSAGASGAIFGLTGAFFIILIKKRKYYWSIIYFGICVFFYIYTIDPRINYISHFFGFITGLIIYLICLFVYQHVTVSNRFLV
ncbi:MAG: rhomboid family intramembrane serine protease [Candidatus Hermodarchaeota archaeon]